MKKYLMIIVGALITLIITGILLFLSLITNIFAVTIDTSNILPIIKVETYQDDSNLKTDYQKISSDLKNNPKFIYQGEDKVYICDNSLANNDPFWNIKVNEKNQLELIKKQSDINFIVDHGDLILNDNDIALDLSGTKYENNCTSVGDENE